jgi:DNA repair exonuclease SbcCD ATPase subunit
MRISLLRVTAYKGARSVEIKPPADVYLLLIAGENGAGKSSTLDAITVAFEGPGAGGKRMPRMPVTRGEEHASIYIELDDGALKVDRVIEPDGSTHLTVSDAEGPLRRPQERLDRLIGARFVDPLRFLRIDAAEQRKALLRIIPNATEIEQLDERADRTFKQRTEVGRHLKHARGELERLPKVAAAPAPIDVAGLVAEQRRFAEQQRELDAIESNVTRIALKQSATSRAVESLTARVQSLELELAAARRSLAEMGEIEIREKNETHGAQIRLDEARAAWRSCEPRRQDIERDLSRAGEHNRKVGEQEAAIKRRAETEATVERLAGEVDTMTANLDVIEGRKKAILAAAELPVDGLEIASDGIRIRGVPFDQAAAHEQMEVAISLAMAGSLDDVCIRDGALLDDKTIELIVEHAKKRGKRVWLEFIDDVPGAIVIRDGRTDGAP